MHVINFLKQNRVPGCFCRGMIHTCYLTLTPLEHIGHHKQQHYSEWYFRFSVIEPNIYITGYREICIYWNEYICFPTFLHVLYVYMPINISSILIFHPQVGNYIYSLSSKCQNKAQRSIFIPGISFCCIQNRDIPCTHLRAYLYIPGRYFVILRKFVSYSQNYNFTLSFLGVFFFFFLSAPLPSPQF